MGLRTSLAVQAIVLTLAFVAQAQDAVETPPVPVAVPNAEPALPDPSTFAVPPAGLPSPPRETAPGPVAGINADPCGLAPEKVCSALLDEFHAGCIREVSGLLAICREGPSITGCAARCEGNWRQGKHDIALGKLARAHIERVAALAEELDAEIEANDARIAGIKAGAQKRIVHIYVNENDDTIIEHRGEPFTPEPPLRYTGTSGGALDKTERGEIATLEKENRHLEAEIGELIGEADGTAAWWRDAVIRWEPAASAADGRCDDVRNDANRDACLASCKGAAPEQTVNACHATYVPHLAAPYGRAWLYPPGDPRALPIPDLE